MAFVSKMSSGSKIRQGWDPRWLALGALGAATVVNVLVPTEFSLPESEIGFEAVRFEALPENDLQKPPRTIFQAIARRSLFTEGRQLGIKLEGSQSPNKLNSAADKFQLLGIAVAPSGRSALIRVGERSDVLTIRTGHKFGGWTVLEIDADYVRLSIGQRLVDLRLPKSALAEEQVFNGVFKEK